jgi:hypothetical protein
MCRVVYVFNPQPLKCLTQKKYVFSLIEFVQEKDYVIICQKNTTYVFVNVRLCNLPFFYLTVLYQLLRL